MSAIWWGVPGLAGLGLGITEAVGGAYGWGVVSIVVGVLLLAYAGRQYKETGRLWGSARSL